MTLVLDSIRSRAAEAPERIAIDPLDGAPLTYRQLVSRTEELATELRAAHLPGRPLALRMNHGRELALLELALLEAGLPVLSLPSFFSETQCRHAITACGAAALLGEYADVQHFSVEPVVLPSGTARITFTSGSTGTPKGVCLSAPHMLEVAQSVVATVGDDHAGRHLALLPPGILLETVSGFLATMIAGGTYVCPGQVEIGFADPFEPDVRTLVRVLREARISSLILVPEYLGGLVRMLEASGFRLPDLTLVAVGGARVPPALIARARMLGLPVRQGYGLTECASVVSIETSDDDTPGSAGPPLRHMRARVAADGEILLEGSLCLGTIGGSGQAGPLHTGDLGRIDDVGRLWIDGRKSNVIVTSFGRNISPEWVEEALLAQPAIAQAMVYGDGLPRPAALLVPAVSGADLDQAVVSANALLPSYARVGDWREVSAFTARNGQLTGNGRLRRKAVMAAHVDPPSSFFGELEAATSGERSAFLGVAQVQAGLAGAISRAAYLAYLTEAYHHVRHTVPLMQAARSRLSHRPDLAGALDDYVAEESGHEEWILADIAAAGGDADAAREAPPSPATRAMVEYAYDRIRSGNPVAFFGMIYVLESVSVALAQRGATAVAERLGLPPEAFTYLSSHGALDRDHLRFFAELVDGLADQADRDAITRTAKDIFALYGGVFASIDLEEQDVAA